MSMFQMSCLSYHFETSEPRQPRRKMGAQWNVRLAQLAASWSWQFAAATGLGESYEWVRACRLQKQSSRAFLYERAGFCSFEEQVFDPYFEPGCKGYHSIVWYPEVITLTLNGGRVAVMEYVKWANWTECSITAFRFGALTDKLDREKDTGVGRRTVS